MERMTCDKSMTQCGLVQCQALTSHAMPGLSRRCHVQKCRAVACHTLCCIEPCQMWRQSFSYQDLGIGTMTFIPRRAKIFIPRSGNKNRNMIPDDSRWLWNNLKSFEIIWNHLRVWKLITLPFRIVGHRWITRAHRTLKKYGGGHFSGKEKAPAAT